MTEPGLGSRTIAELQWAGYRAVGLVCRRCSHSAVIPMAELRRRRASTLTALNARAYCARCEVRGRGRHHDVLLQPLREGEPWP